MTNNVTFTPEALKAVLDQAVSEALAAAGEALAREVTSIQYGNFKAAVKDKGVLPSTAGFGPSWLMPVIS